MRIAVCISGQPRKALDTFPFIYENIIKPNSADVFIHMNYDKESTYIEKTHLDSNTCNLEKNVDEKLIELYKPIKYLVEKPKNFYKPNIIVSEKRLQNTRKMNAHKNWTNEECQKHITKQLLSMYYSIFKCNELKETYANENGFVYDLVIRLRFDVLPKQPLYLQTIDPNYIYYLEIGQPDQLISDWINFGSNAVMNVYSSIYLNIEYLNTLKYFTKNDRLPNNIEASDICGGLYEMMLRDLMTLYKIPKMGFLSDIILVY